MKVIHRYKYSIVFCSYSFLVCNLIALFFKLQALFSQLNCWFLSLITSFLFETQEIRTVFFTKLSSESCVWHKHQNHSQTKNAFHDAITEQKLYMFSFYGWNSFSMSHGRTIERNTDDTQIFSYSKIRLVFTRHRQSALNRVPKNTQQWFLKALETPRHSHLSAQKSLAITLFSIFCAMSPSKVGINNVKTFNPIIWT